jgi:hypothetical protein
MVIVVAALLVIILGGEIALITLGTLRSMMWLSSGLSTAANAGKRET